MSKEKCFIYVVQILNKLWQSTKESVKVNDENEKNTRVIG